MRRFALVLLAVFLTAGGLTAVQPQTSASEDSAPAPHPVVRLHS